MSKQFECVGCGATIEDHYGGPTYPQPYGPYLRIVLDGFYGSTVLDTINPAGDPVGYTCGDCTERFFTLFPRFRKMVNDQELSERGWSQDAERVPFY